MDIAQLTSRIEMLTSQKGVSINKMTIDCGISKSFFYDLKNKGTKPSVDVIDKLADYFNVSTDYILGKTDIKKEPSPEMEEKALALGQYLLDKGIVPDLSDESLSVVMDILIANTDIIKKLVNKDK
ncbi:MAG: helix-turn-helix domain-containing protein [Eubacteriales bacterium]